MQRYKPKELHNVKHDKLTNCCAITNIYDFANTRKSGCVTRSVPIKHLEASLKEKLREYSVRNKAIVLVALNQDQHDLLRHMMKRCGFKMVSSGYHPSHRNEVYLYTLTYQRSAKRPKVVTNW